MYVCIYIPICVCVYVCAHTRHMRFHIDKYVFVLVQVGDMPIEKMNTRGGSLSLGHPFGATGTRYANSYTTMLACIRAIPLTWTHTLCYRHSECKFISIHALYMNTLILT
jgi:hypothetical protein